METGPDGFERTTCSACTIGKRDRKHCETCTYNSNRVKNDLCANCPCWYSGYAQACLYCVHNPYRPHGPAILWNISACGSCNLKRVDIDFCMSCECNPFVALSKAIHAVQAWNE